MHLLHEQLIPDGQPTERPLVPFLYYSDHEIQGFHIYTVLKSGGRATAWASDIMTCQTLEYAGPRKQQTIDFYQLLISQTRSTHPGQPKPAQTKE